MNATTDERSAADLEREGEQIRASLDRTLDEIQHRLSPAELLDRSMEFVRENGMDLLREAGETVRRNPVPFALTAAGLVWLATSIAKSRSAGDAGQDLSDYRAQSNQGYWRNDEYVESGWDRSAHSRVRNAAHEMKRKVTGRVSTSMDAVQSRAQGVGWHLTNLVQEQPLALGALALAAGALLGAALPMTEYENKWVGPVHDRTMARAKEVGKREYENIRQAVKSSQARVQRGTDESRDAGNGSQRST